MANGRPYSLKVNKLPLPTYAPNDYTFGAYCLKLSPYWYFLLQGALELFTVRALWKWTEPEEWLQVKDWLTVIAALPRTCEECEDCEECPPTPENTVGSGCCDSPVGVLGMTLEELEQALMGCLDISNSIRYNPDLNQIEVWSCKDGWIAIPGMVGQLINSAKPQTGLTPLQNAVNSGSLSLLQPGYVYTPPPEMTTIESQACSVATAMQDGWFLIMGELRGVLDYVTIGTISSQFVAEAILVEIASLPAVVVGGVALVITAAILADDIEELKAEIDAQIANTALRTEMICELTTNHPSFNGSNVVSGSQLLALTLWWRDHMNPSTSLKNMMYAFPDGWVADTMRNLVPQTPCGCTDFLPYNYSAPVNDEAVAVYKAMVHTTNVASEASGSQNMTGQPYEQIVLTPIGTKIGTNTFRSAYVSQASGSFYQALAVLIEFPFEVEQIDAFKFDATPNGVLTGWKVFENIYDAIDGWKGQSLNESIVLTGEVDHNVEIGGSWEGDNNRYIILTFRSKSTNSLAYFDISNIRFSGTINGYPFLDLDLGAPL